MTPCKKCRQAIYWIAYNDDAEEKRLDAVSQYLSVALVADLFNKDPASIAALVVHVREGGWIKASDRVDYAFERSFGRVTNDWDCIPNRRDDVK